MEIEGQDVKSAFFHSASEPKVKVLLNTAFFPKNFEDTESK